MRVSQVSLQNRLILFFFVTSFGSALSSVATFLSIEHYFRSLILLGIALSIRTLASAVFSYVANDLIQRLGLMWSLLVSQIFGCGALLVLFLGFHFDIFIITILGIVLTGLPSTFVAILMTIVLRISSDNSALFRKYSGKREVVFGVSMFLSTMLAPVLLWKFNLNFVLLIDSLSYVIGFIILLKFTIRDPITLEEDNTKPQALRRILLTSKNVQEYVLKTSASLLLAGLLPLLASSSQIQFTMDMPTLMRQWLWSIEDITAISASLLYLFLSIIRKYKFFDLIVMLNGAWLIIAALLTHNYSIIISVIVICLLTDFSGQKFRDDLIISAGSNSNLVKSYSALSSFQRNFIFFVSPILLSFLISYTTIKVDVFIIILIQVSLYIMYRAIDKS